MSVPPIPPVPPVPPQTPPSQPKLQRPATVPRAEAINCKNCGAAMQVRTFGGAVNVVCDKCGSVLDPKDPKHAVLEVGYGREKALKTLIPLGSRGKWKGQTYEVVGFQRRTIRVEGVDYSWFEYLLFNPYHGYRYLTEYNGHWNDVTIVKGLPKIEPGVGKPLVNWQNRVFTHFQSAHAKTTFILGEFPWQVRLNDAAKTNDYIAPPFILSAEETEGEVTWSLGEYTNYKDVEAAFKLQEKLSPPYGIFANQPNPYGEHPKQFWNSAAMLFLALVALLVLTFLFTSNKEVFKETYQYQQQQGVEPSFVTPVFELGGRASNVEVEFNTNLHNNWAYFACALINEETGEAFDFGREVSYYTGYDSDGSWSEGGRTDDVTLPSVPAGKYYLRIEPEMQPGATPVTYTVTIKRDVPKLWLFAVALFLIAIPPIIVQIKAKHFEFNRWQESDYAVDTSGDDDDE